MTRINFYILQSSTETALVDFSCRLIEKAFRQGNRVLAYTGTSIEAEQLSEQLWAFKPESYIPHALNKANGKASNINLSEPVLISHSGTQPKERYDFILNLSHDIPDGFASSPRFAQVVNQSPKRLESSRKHFAFFKERGYAIEVNKLNR